MNRGLWFVAGAGAGMYAAFRARRAAEALTTDGLRDRIGAAAVGARMFRDEVAQGRADAEPELRRQLGVPLDAEGRHRALPPVAPTDDTGDAGHPAGSGEPRELHRSREGENS